jgi:hypothetical protein
MTAFQPADDLCITKARAPAPPGTIPGAFESARQAVQEPERPDEAAHGEQRADRLHAAAQYLAVRRPGVTGHHAGGSKVDGDGAVSSHAPIVARFTADYAQVGITLESAWGRR